MSSCLKCPLLSELVCFLVWELSVSFYIVHRHRVCLVEHVDLICSLYSWWEGFGSSLATLPLGFNCGFISAWLSSTDISYQNLLPHISLVYLSTVNSSPCPGIAPQSLNSSSQMPCLPGDLCPCLGYIWLRQGLSDSHSI